MAYVSLYRKYRSQSFGELIGQDHVVRTLQNSIASGRVSHSYLFTGPRGTGKTSTARLLAKALCCENGPTAEPCNACEICRSITEGSCIDVYEMDAASDSGVEDVRETIVEVVNYQPAMARYKVFVIDEVHDLSGKAFDALLKTIEEPPAHIIFILATTELFKVPPTIRSRCQKYEFHRGSLSHLLQRLEHVAKGEKVKAEPGALLAIAKMADGGYRDAMTLLEQAIIASGGETLTLEGVYDQLGLVSEDTVDRLLNAIKESDAREVLGITEELGRRGRDPRAIVSSMLHRISDLTRVLYGVDEAMAEDPAREATARELAARLGSAELNRIRSAVAQLSTVLRDASLPRLVLDAELLGLTERPSVPTPAPARPADPPTEKPVAKPAPKAKAVAEVAEAPAAAAPEPTKVEPQPEVAAHQAPGVWGELLRTIPSGTTISMKLQQSEVAEQSDSSLVVEVPKMHLEWLNAKPERRRFVVDQLRSLTGKEFTVEYRARNGASNHEVATVELPLEGEELRDTASRVFGEKAE